MKTSKSLIQEFLNLKTFALVGASAKKKKFGNEIFKQMVSRGMKVYPIHRSARRVEGAECYRNLNSLPERPDGVILCVTPEQSEKVVLEMTNAGITHVWMQRGATSKAAVNYCNSRGIKVVYDECMLMFLENSGFPHSIHKWIWNLNARA